MSAIILKPYKDDYFKIKAYHPIVLLGCISKLCEKVIGAWLHHECGHYDILHPNQFGSMC